jgi:hypothetical protein
MDIKNCIVSDIDDILSLYEAARSLQIQRKMVVWPPFDARFLEREINEQRQWKLTIDHQIACNWTITFEDKEIWGDKDQNNAIYIHRICTKPQFRGNRYIDNIVNWAKSYARSQNK